MTQTSTEQGRTDMDSRPDVIQEPEENKNIKITIEEHEVVVLFTQWPERKDYIWANLSRDMKGKLIEILKISVNCFAWSHYDMTGIAPEVMTHNLNEDTSYPPIRQKNEARNF